MLTNKGMLSMRKVGQYGLHTFYEFTLLVRNMNTAERNTGTAICRFTKLRCRNLYARSSLRSDIIPILLFTEALFVVFVTVSHFELQAVWLHSRDCMLFQIHVLKRMPLGKDVAKLTCTRATGMAVISKYVITLMRTVKNWKGSMVIWYEKIVARHRTAKSIKWMILAHDSLQLKVMTQILLYLQTNLHSTESLIGLLTPNCGIRYIFWLLWKFESSALNLCVLCRFYPPNENYSQSIS